MNDEFKIEIDEWLASGAGTPEIQETTAEISIQVNNVYVTEVEDRRARSVRKTIRASAYVLASWLTSNWWRLRWEPDKNSTSIHSQSLDWQMTHQLCASGGGYVWPPVTFSSDGYHILVRCEGAEISADESLSPIRYLNSFEEPVGVSSFEAAASNFIERVLARLDARGIKRSPLRDLWAEIRTERTKEPLGTKRKLEALLGVDPDEEDELIDGLLEWQRRVGLPALEEIAAASGTQDIEAFLQTTAVAAKSVHTFSRITDYHKIKGRLADKGSLADHAPWKLGKESARVVREIWGLDKKPVKNQVIADRLNVSESIVAEAPSAVPVAVGMRGPEEEQLKLLLKPSHPNRRRFDLARLIGDHVFVDAGDEWKPATHSMTARQKFQRAFAAEFLCPSDELYERFTNSELNVDDVDEKSLEVAKEYQVSQQVVLRHMENQRLIDASCRPGPGFRGFTYSSGY